MERFRGYFHFLKFSSQPFKFLKIPWQHGFNLNFNSIFADKFISRPYFGDAETEVTVQQGEAAFFNCHVFNLANQTVSSKCFNRGAKNGFRRGLLKGLLKKKILLSNPSMCEYRQWQWVDSNPSLVLAQ